MLRWSVRARSANSESLSEGCPDGKGHSTGIAIDFQIDRYDEPYPTVPVSPDRQLKIKFECSVPCAKEWPVYASNEDDLPARIRCAGATCNKASAAPAVLIRARRESQPQRRSRASEQFGRFLPCERIAMPYVRCDPVHLAYPSQPFLLRSIERLARSRPIVWS
jgi:hypothetical protein